MTRLLLPLALCAVATSGCKRRQPAPEQMEELAGFMIRVWEDKRSLTDALDNLSPWLEANAHSDDAQTGYVLTPLSDEDVSTLDHPRGDLSLLIGASVAGVSPHGMGPHARAIVHDDQIYSNPNSYNQYDRHVDGDVDAFLDGEGIVRTANDVTTTRLGVTIPYQLFKDYRWVEGEAGRAIIARSWIAEPGCNAGGGNCLEQSFSVDLWLEQDEGCLRFTSTWSQVKSSIAVPAALQVRALANGMAEVFIATDTFIEEGGAN